MNRMAIMMSMSLSSRKKAMILKYLIRPRYLNYDYILNNSSLWNYPVRMDQDFLDFAKYELLPGILDYDIRKRKKQKEDGDKQTN